MKNVRLGQTSVKIGRLCYGTEPFAIKKGPDGAKTQGDKIPEEGGAILAEASKLGVTLWDTSDDYGTHPHVREGLKRVNRSDVAIADKSNAATYEEGEKAVEFSLTDLGTKYVDIMFLHNLPAKPIIRRDASGREYTSQGLKGRMGALKSFTAAKDEGLVKATALSTHSNEVLRQALDVPEIDIVCTPLNRHGAYVEDGTLQERLDALKALHDAGKGVYVIKLLNAGRFRDEAEPCIKYALGFNDFIDAWNIGMYDVTDVKRNLELFNRILG
ncbi:MAG: aldo/keto reductase [Candidatus Bathyarchaeota archaeon]|nr:aldo/keto reductase [Candidatus Bathyarchaeota archaeon]